MKARIRNNRENRSYRAHTGALSVRALAEKSADSAVVTPLVSGAVKEVRAEVVYEKDQFEYELGPKKAINFHRPAVGDRGKLACVYAVGCDNDHNSPEFMPFRFRSNKDR